MEVERPKYFTEKQSELLQIIFPAPIGLGWKMKEACETLGIGVSAGYARLRAFKIRFPEAYKVYETSKKIMWNQKDELRGGARYGYSIEEPYNFGWENRIKERF